MTILRYVLLTSCLLWQCQCLSNVVKLDPRLYHNSMHHHTDKFKFVEHLVLRRSHTFDLSLKLDKPLDNTTEQVFLELKLGKSPNEYDGSRLLLNIELNDNVHVDLGRWSASVTSRDGNELGILVAIPFNAPVGLWEYRVSVKGNGQKSHSPFYKMYLLFNPWSPYDEVYFEDNIGRGEYVLNDVGKVYHSPGEDVYSLLWIYGQYKEGVLEAVIFILDKCGLTTAQRSRVVDVTARLSALLNSNDDNGVLWGQWHEPYIGHRKPSDWTGSAEILLQYHQTHGQPVKYAQCWVYAAVLATVFRALGIAARPVTNVQSGHDTNNDLAITYFYKNGQRDYSRSRDSYWNFHVWTEAWMTRVDFEDRTYDGWQVLDATPQEPSGGIYKLGPAPVKAVKAGNINEQFEVAFVFSEVNGDFYKYYFDYRNGRYPESVPADERFIGQKIVTQRAGVLGRNLMFKSEDLYITHDYKYPEGSLLERSTYKRALGFLHSRRIRSTNNYNRSYSVQDIDFKMNVKVLNSIPIGNSIFVPVYLENLTNRKQTIDLSVNSMSIYYNGTVAHVIKSQTTRFDLEPGYSDLKQLVVLVDDYRDKLVEFSIIRLFTLAISNSTGYIVSNTKDVVLTMPQLELSVPDELREDEPFRMTIYFRNPPYKDLQNCQITTETRDFGPERVRELGVRSGRVFHQDVLMIIKKRGNDSIVVKMSCDDSIILSGQKAVQVLGPTPNEVPLSNSLH